LAEKLLKEGHTVLVIDDLSTGAIENIQHLKEHARFRCVIDTVTNESLLAELVDSADAVFHLAAVVGVRLVVDEPVRTIQTNIHSTELVLKHASKKNKKVILTSTSEIYGKSSQLPYREESDLVYGPTTKSRWSYAFSKGIDEFLGLAYFRTCGLPVVIMRLFNTVGPRQTGYYGMVLPRFIYQALMSQPISVYGDGRQTRCFCHVNDVTRAYTALMENRSCEGEIFNVGGSEEVSILGLAERIQKRVNPKVSIQFIPYERAFGSGFEDMQHRRPDISKIQKAIGFKPGYTLDQMIDDVAASMRIKLGL
jgi:UDP-glucose 4-epimerase